VNKSRGLVNMTRKTDCLLCGEELIYLDKPKKIPCIFCNNLFETEVTCINNHYVCDNCHRMNADDLIQKICVQTKETNPFTLAETLMNHETFHMHGPEHHFLVPAVLLTTYYNTIKQYDNKKEKIELARERSRKILGGFCGTHGVCGAAIGTGIFISIITESNPLKKKEWHLSNLITAQSLETIAKHGGPRCCKRNTYLSFYTAIDFVKTHFNTVIPHDTEKQCYFSQLNKECIQFKCPYFAITEE
jgi:hypothetical protein